MVVAVATIIASSQPADASPLAKGDWREDWSIQEGFSITEDVGGFHFPTAIAFVPEPGGAPKDPLYFVAELRGAIKVVTNDRTVYTFAEDFFRLEPRSDVVPTIGEEIGMAGICLAPSDGYVFVTFTYHDSNGILRNNLARFETNPTTFSVAPTSQTEFTSVFADYQSIPSHQISACQVQRDQLYVNVGDAGQIIQSQRADSLFGKVLRMTLDGAPSPGNPYYEDADTKKARNYVWAMGLRNAFGLKVVGDRVFVADNGPTVDRFLQIQEGGNYLWDGTNISIGTNADVLFAPGRGVAQLDHHAADLDLFPGRFRESFFMTMTGNPVVHRPGYPAIWGVPFDMSRERLSSPPEFLLRYRGTQAQVVSALAFGLDGLYFAPLVPRPGEELTRVLKIRHNPEAGHPFILGEELSPISLMHTLGCIQCHSWPDNPGGIVGPNLAEDVLVPKLVGRLNSEDYLRSTHELDVLDEEPFRSFREARNEVIEAQDLEKIRLWIYYRLLEPRFDDPGATMPQLGVTDRQAHLIADFLSGSETEDATEPSGGFANTVKDAVGDIKDLFPKPTRANAAEWGVAIFGVGLVGGGLITVASGWAIWKWRRRRSRPVP